MAKSKSKNKVRKPPQEKFLVVVDPWRYRNFFEDIGAWFEIMLQDDYPGTRVDMIYGQVGKHHNVIVQLPDNVDIHPLLGAHRHATILKPPHNTNNEGVSYIFEYNFENEGYPRDWATVSPSYETIDPSFPVRFPYPIPSPVPQTRRNSKPGYARQLPKDLWEENAVTSIALPIQTENVSSSSVPSSSKPLAFTTTSSTFTPYVPPSHHPSHTTYPDIKPSNIDEKHGLKKESDHTQDPLTKKQDPYEQVDTAEAFLHSVLPSKQEDVSPRDGYQPSSELLATFATLPEHLLNASPAASTSVTVKREAIADNYHPSNELLATFATLPAQFLNQGGSDWNAQPFKQEDSSHPRIKPEPRDNDHVGHGLDASLRARSVTLGAEMNNVGPPNLTTRVKNEQQDNVDALSSNSAVKPLYPRKRPQAPVYGPSKKIKLQRGS